MAAVGGVDGKRTLGSGKELRFAAVLSCCLGTPQGGATRVLRVFFVGYVVLAAPHRALWRRWHGRPNRKHLTPPAFRLLTFTSSLGSGSHAQSDGRTGLRTSVVPLLKRSTARGRARSWSYRRDDDPPPSQLLSWNWGRKKCPLTAGVMVGYSDRKQGSGIFASQWGLPKKAAKPGWRKSGEDAGVPHLAFPWKRRARPRGAGSDASVLEGGCRPSLSGEYDS